MSQPCAEKDVVAESQIMGKRVLITGASGGIGGAIARAFAAEGAMIVATAPDGAGLSVLSKQISAAGGQCRVVVGDLEDLTFCGKLGQVTEPVDILINAAGWLRHTPFLEGDPADFAKAFRINVVGLLAVTQSVATEMVQRGHGHIINVSSALARAVYPFTMVYAASKHAVAAISQGLRLELNAKGIKVTELCPGLVGDTGLLAGVTHPDVIESYRRRGYQPINADDVARVAVLAASLSGRAEINLLEVKPLGQP